MCGLQNFPIQPATGFQSKHEIFMLDKYLIWFVKFLGGS